MKLRDGSTLSVMGALAHSQASLVLFGLVFGSTLPKTPLKGDFFVYSAVQHQQSNLVSPNIKGSPPGVHMHVCEVFFYLLDYCARFADRCSVLVEKSRFSPFQGHSWWLGSQMGPTSLILWQEPLLVHNWRCAKVPARLGPQGPLCRRKSLCSGGASPHFRDDWQTQTAKRARHA